MKYISLFLLTVLIFTSCSQREKRVLRRVPVEKPIPLPIEKQVVCEIAIPGKIPIPGEKSIPCVIPGLIPETIIKQAEKKYNKFSRMRYEAFNAKLKELQKSSDIVKLREINNFFNKVPYSDDINVWYQKDYWATPWEFLGKDRGDCEDYVIAKYFALLNLGIDGQKLYLSRVNSKNFKRAHMVLSYYETPSSTPLILDSTNLKILPVDKRDDLIFIYNFNGNSLCFTRESGHLNNTKVFKKWDKLLDDIEIDKF